MARYTFITEVHRHSFAGEGSDKSKTVDIPSESDIGRIADAAVAAAQEEWRRDQARLSDRIEKAANAADAARMEAAEAAQAAVRAETKAEALPGQIAENARDSFRATIQEALAPLLETGLQQILGNQQQIQNDHRNLADLAAGMGAKTTSLEEKTDRLAEENGTLRENIDAIRTEAAAAWQAGEKLAAALAAENRKLQDGLEACRRDAEASAREFARKQVGLEEENTRLREDIAALQKEVSATRNASEEVAGAWRTMREEWAGTRENIRDAGTRTRKTCFVSAGVAILSAMLGLCAWLGRYQGTDAPAPEGAPAALRQSGTEDGETGATAGLPPEHGIEDSQDKLPVLARAGDKDAQIRLGNLLLEGRDIKGTDEETVRWVLLAAQNGNADAGPWLADQAGKGNAYAQMVLGRMAEKAGQRETAAEWYRKAAARGDAKVSARARIDLARLGVDE